MIEYAITDGEGTLLAYGVLDEENFECLDVPKGATLLVRTCADDCETGK